MTSIEDELYKIIKSRRSIREYTTQAVDEYQIDRLLEAARWGPTAGNMQPLEIVIVKDNDNKMALTSSAGGQEFLTECNVVFVMCANIPRTAKKYKERGEELYTIQDIAAATQNIHLLAKSMGLGTCWVGAFNEIEVSKICKLPRHVRPMVMISIGYPDLTNLPVERPRRELGEFVHSEIFSQ